jgi:hypothetical protein
MDPKPPDSVVLGTEWPERALLRAQLIEEGHEAVALDTWPISRLYRRPGMKPRVLVIDLHRLPQSSAKRWMKCDSCCRPNGFWW